MKIDKSMLGILAGVSLFIGFVIFSVAVGAVFPSMHKLPASLVCQGDVKVESIKYSYKPGQVGWDNHIYCVDEQGTQKEITFPAIGVTGLISSAVIFVLLVIGMRSNILQSQNFGTLASDLKRDGKSASSAKRKTGSAMERLTELKKLRDENLITNAEYEKKKAEIMDNL